jgi:hypothetical protein
MASLGQDLPLRNYSKYDSDDLRTLVKLVAEKDFFDRQAKNVSDSECER